MSLQKNTKTLKLCTQGSAFLRLRLTSSGGDPVLTVMKRGAEPETEPFSTNVPEGVDLQGASLIWGGPGLSTKIDDKIVENERTLRIEIEIEREGDAPNMQWQLSEPGPVSAEILETEGSSITTAIVRYAGREPTKCECTLLEVDVGLGVGVKAKTIILPQPTCPEDTRYVPS